ncbi:PP0621 family protein [Verminephrobacter eiseniae]|uniref:Pyrimidine deaminase n=1 Tax=Verminephrobacter eiseniae (strain EF01-2) TaxID=391735 RepID=A1WI03_VEREI|nr:PP0621 family protein [Verminephrobacter eiseniae]KAB7630682.1 hypothetical protein ET532_002095 [Verminephrobacter sp. Larva24]ABM57260.1 conserved hypothetical protein [Verminephrobacter eiseniae EF01-2]MCW5234289.1 hypothetical protein [Verminephrobacter eiseniae]MCW5236262.1 hypothetical protein [Verminephrobacter eiseniae]MCW5262449.1 hypothetical protein [Verminephrobacter eiseniae]
MKYLVLLLVLALAIIIWRSRRAPDAAAPKPGPAAQAPPDILACAHCGLHIPRAEALMLGDQAFCCAQHRQQHQGPV